MRLKINAPNTFKFGDPLTVNEYGDVYLLTKQERLLHKLRTGKDIEPLGYCVSAPDEDNYILVEVKDYI